MDSEQPVVKPAPPPEAALIRTGRLASGLGIADAVAILEARGIRVSVSRWSQIENGYQTKGGRYLPVSGGAGQLAHMASVSGITPEELAQSRPDAAKVLAEVLRRQHGGVVVPKPAIAGRGEVALPQSPAEAQLAAYAARLSDTYPALASFIDAIVAEDALEPDVRLGLLALMAGMKEAQDRRAIA